MAKMSRWFRINNLDVVNGELVIDWELDISDGGKFDSFCEDFASHWRERGVSDTGIATQLAVIRRIYPKEETIDE